MQLTVATGQTSGTPLWLRTVLAAVVAMVIAGSVAAPANARTRDDGKQEANDFVTACFAMGGEPEVIEASDEWIIATCHLPNGSTFTCDWWTNNDWSQHCHLSHSVPGGDLPVHEFHDVGPIDGVFVEDESVPATPGAVYAVDPIWTLADNASGTEAPRLAGDDTQAAPPVDAPLVAESELTAPVEVVEAEADVVETPAEAPTSAAVTEVVDIPAEEPVAAEEPMAGEVSAEQP